MLQFKSTPKTSFEKYFIESWDDDFLNSTQSMAAARFHQFTLVNSTGDSENSDCVIGFSKNRLVTAFSYRVEKRKFMGLTLEFIRLGAYHISDIYLAEDCELIASEIADYLFDKHPQCQWIESDRATKSHFDALATSLPKKTKTIVSKAEYYSVISVKNRSYEELLKDTSKNSRSKLRKFRTRIQNLGYSFRWSTPTSVSENLGLFDRYVDIEQRSWKAKNSSDLSHSHARLSSYREMVGIAYNINCISWFEMLDGKKVIASMMLFHRGRDCWVFKTSFDDDYKSYSPGIVILDRFIEEAMDKKLFDNIDLITDYEWHKQWRPEQRPYYSLKIFNRSVKGRLVYQLFDLKSRLKK